MSHSKKAFVNSADPDQADHVCYADKHFYVNKTSDRQYFAHLTISKAMNIEYCKNCSCTKKADKVLKNKIK